MTVDELDACVRRRYELELEQGLNWWGNPSHTGLKVAVAEALRANEQDISVLPPAHLIPLLMRLATLGMAHLADVADD